MYEVFSYLFKKCYPSHLGGATQVSENRNDARGDSLLERLLSPDYYVLLGMCESHLVYHDLQ